MEGMPRLLFLLALHTSLVLPLLGSDSPKGYDDRTEADELQGAWRAVAWESAGVRHADEGAVIHTFRGGRWWTCLVGDPVGAYAADAGHYPARLDKTEFLGDGEVQTWKCIYRREGDTLRIAATSEAGRRPKSFDDKDTFIFTYQR